MKNLGEMALINKTAASAGFQYTPIGVAKQLLGPFNLSLENVLIRWCPSALFEGLGEVIHAESGHLGECRQRNIILEVLIDVFQHPV